jgi:hypothetical protein
MFKYGLIFAAMFVLSRNNFPYKARLPEGGYFGNGNKTRVTPGSLEQCLQYELVISNNKIVNLKHIYVTFMAV